MNQSS